MPPSVSAVFVALSLRPSPSRRSSASSLCASMFCNSVWPASACAKRPAISFCEVVIASSRGVSESGELARVRPKTTKTVAKMNPAAIKITRVVESSIACLPWLRPALDRTSALAYLRLMAIRPILTAPDPRLKEVSHDVERVDGEIRMLIDDMFDSMYEAKGIGLAAIQIGVPKRVIVMDLAQTEGETEPYVFINPKLLWTSDDIAVAEEGCLSVPDIWDNVERPARIKAEHLDG